MPFGLMSCFGKNCFNFWFLRATVEYHRHSDKHLPDIEVTIAVNEDELLIRYEYEIIISTYIYIYIFL